MKQATTIQKSEEPVTRTMVTMILLVCGIISSLLYVGTDILAAMLYEGYSYVNQAISELSAIGAPTRPLWVAMSSLYNPLMIAFGIGVWLSAGSKRSLRVTGGLLVAYGAIGQVWALFAPMHQRGAEGSLTDVVHIVFTFATVLLIVLFIGFGSGARGKAFRIYSIATILVLLVFGALAGMQGSAIATGELTPWFGIIERVNVYGSMIWVLVFAIALLGMKYTQPVTTTVVESGSARSDYSSSRLTATRNGITSGSRVR